MRSGAPVRKLKLASGGRGEMQFDTESLPKSSLSLRKTSKTIKHSKRLSSRRDDVERELVLRLASLLWRVRRASAIETDLFQIQARDPERSMNTRLVSDRVSPTPNQALRP